MLDVLAHDGEIIRAAVEQCNIFGYCIHGEREGSIPPLSMRHIVVFVRCYVRLLKCVQYMVRGYREFEGWMDGGLLLTGAVCGVAAGDNNVSSGADPYLNLESA